MSVRQLVISPAVRDDLKGITRFGLLNWGDIRAQACLEQFKTLFLTLAEQPGIGLDRSILLPDLRSFPVGSHVVFYRASFQQLDILRILHARQDPERHLQGQKTAP